MVKYIEVVIDGVKMEVPVRISYFALMTLKEKTGKNLEELGDDAFEAYQYLFWAAVVAGCNGAGKPKPFEEDQAMMALDSCFFKFISIIPEFMAEIAGEAQGAKNVNRPEALPRSNRKK